MRTRIEVTDLSQAQWKFIGETVQTAYNRRFGPWACVVFKLGEVERHAETPLAEFLGVVTSLHTIGKDEAAEAALAETAGPDEPPNLLQQVRDARRTVRDDCAFCHRERSAHDVNHAPDCPYWTVGPGSVTP